MKTATKPTGGVRIVAQDKDTLLLYWLDADGQPSRHMPPGIASIVRHRHGPLDVLWGPRSLGGVAGSLAHVGFDDQPPSPA
jgi:hypothetical protein